MPQQPPATIAPANSPENSAPRAGGNFSFRVLLMLGVVLLASTSCKPRIEPLPSDSPERVSRHAATVVLTPRILDGGSGGRGLPLSSPILKLRLRHETADRKALQLDVNLPAHFHGQPELALLKPLILVMEERDSGHVLHEIRNPAGRLLASAADLRDTIIRVNEARARATQRDTVSGLVLGSGCILAAGIMRFRDRRRAKQASGH